MAGVDHEAGCLLGRSPPLRLGSVQAGLTLQISLVRGGWQAEGNSRDLWWKNLASAMVPVSLPSGLVPLQANRPAEVGLVCPGPWAK